MPVNLDQYRGVVGAFKSHLHSKNIYISISIRMLDVLPIASAFLSILLTFIMFFLFSKSFCFTILLRKNIKILNMLLLSVSNDDDNLEIPGNDLFRADHPSNTK